MPTKKVEKGRIETAPEEKPAPVKTTQGVRIIKLEEGEHVVGVEPLAEPEAEEVTAAAPAEGAAAPDASTDPADAPAGDAPAGDDPAAS